MLSKSELRSRLLNLSFRLSYSSEKLPLGFLLSTSELDFMRTAVGLLTKPKSWFDAIIVGLK